MRRHNWGKMTFPKCTRTNVRLLPKRDSHFLFKVREIIYLINRLKNKENECLHIHDSFMFHCCLQRPILRRNWMKNPFARSQIHCTAGQAPNTNNRAAFASKKKTGTLNHEGSFIAHGIGEKNVYPQPTDNEQSGDRVCPNTAHLFSSTAPPFQRPLSRRMWLRSTRVATL